MGTDRLTADEGAQPMFLYELAIELDQRSADLVAAASSLGMADVGPTTTLDAAQIAALRAQVTSGRPVLPPLGTAPLPAAPTGPLTAEPLGAADLGGPVSWEPLPTPTAPASWGPPPPPPRPVHANPTAPTAHPGPVFEPAPLGAFAPPPSAPPAAPPAGFPPATGSPVLAPDTPSTTSGFSLGQKVALALVAVLVVGLFGFMVANTGPDKEREQAIAAGDTLTATSADGTTTTAAPTTTTTKAPAQDVYVPTDVTTFCKGGRAVIAFELRLAAATVDQDYGALRTLVQSDRSAWQSDVGVLAQGAPPINLDDIETYQSGYNAWFDVIERSSSFEQMYTELDQRDLLQASNAGEEVGNLVTFHCQE